MSTSDERARDAISNGEARAAARARSEHGIGVGIEDATLDGLLRWRRLPRAPRTHRPDLARRRVPVADDGQDLRALHAVVARHLRRAEPRAVLADQELRHVGGSRGVVTHLATVADDHAAPPSAASLLARTSHGSRLP